jgi:hypothetical protein
MFDKQEYMKEWRRNNRDKLIGYRKNWYDNNKEHIRAYWERTREKTRERQRRWYAKNKKVIKELVEEKIIKIIPKIEAEPEPPKPRGRPKTGRMSATEKKQRKINKDLEEIQKRADQFKMSLQSIDAEKNKDTANSSGNE